MSAGLFYRRESRGLRIFVRLTPKSSKDAIDGLAELADGSTVLKVRVRAAPEKGKANKALIKLVAKWLDMPKSDVALASGSKARLKSLLVQGDASEMARRMSAVSARGE